MTSLNEKKSEDKSTLSKELLKECGLDIKRIQQHQKLVKQALIAKIKPTLSIINPCTTDNGSILSSKNVKKALLFASKKSFKPLQMGSFGQWKKNHLVTCIPAAGAAARFLSELTKFETEEKLFNYIKSIFPENKLALKIFASTKIIIESYLESPKAFIPTTLEGDSFLKLKYIEQLSLFPCLGNALIVPANMKAEFKEKIRKIDKETGTQKIDWFILEQGSELSTLRFNMDGTPFLGENGKYTPVSAGHGELIHLFNPIADQFPTASCLHIRNIDNIIGNSNQNIEELNMLGECFKSMHECISYLRTKTQIKSDLTDKNSYEILVFFSQFFENDDLKKELSECIDKKFGNIKIPYQIFYKILSQLFYWQPLSSECSTTDAWKQIHLFLQRPLSILGVVKKKKNDVGGGPVFARLSDETKVKFCMEMPHANEEDRKKYFGPDGQVQYFNPVLTFFELRNNAHPAQKVDFASLFDENFWLLSKREYKGKPVCYHEIILYELIGNSATTNLVFIEAPRTLFRPHKSYIDSLGQTRKDYGFIKSV